MNAKSKLIIMAVLMPLSQICRAQYPQICDNNDNTALGTSAISTNYAAGIDAVRVATSAALSSDWPGYLFDNGHSSHNSLATAITPANASTLVEDWSFVDPGPTIQGQPGAGFNAGPTVVSGVVYIGSNTGV